VEAILRTSAMMLLMAYATFNMLNVIVLYQNIPTIAYVLAGIGGLWFVQRLIGAGARGLHITQAEVLGFSLLFLTFCTVIAQRIFLRNYIGFDGIDTLGNISSVLILSIIWFFAGGAVAGYDGKESLPMALVVLLTVTVSMGMSAGSDLAISYVEAVYDAGMEGINHLSLEKYVILLLIFSYAMYSKTRWLVVLGGIYVLFLMGGRTALVVFTVTAILMSLREGKTLRNLFGMLIVGTVVFIGLRLLVDSGIMDVQNRGIRRILFLDGLQEDNSFQARTQLFEQSLAMLPDQFWFGDFTLVTKIASFGGYSHNLLSAWQFYGFFVFIALILAMMYCFRRMLHTLRVRGRPADVFGAFMLIYVIISMVLSKSVLWNLLWFTLGFWFLLPPVENLRRRRMRMRRTTPTMPSAQRWAEDGSPMRPGSRSSSSGIVPDIEI